MKVYVGLVLWAVLFGSVVADLDLNRGVNGGIKCAACTLAVGMSQQLMEVNNSTVTNSITKMCNIFPSKEQIFCKILIQLWGAAVLEKLRNGDSPDVVCYSLGMCRVDEDRDFCHLFPVPKEGLEEAIRQSKLSSKVNPWFSWIKMKSLKSVCDLPLVGTVCRALNRSYVRMVPAFDVDNDKFSTVEILRGSAWRGKDCDDFDPNIHPGRKPEHFDIRQDSDCNGIFGVDPATSQPYEKLYCEGTESRGLIYIGDSVGAHYHIPPEWFTPSLITKTFFQNISYILSNEMDWPQSGFSTGYVNISWPTINGHTDSIYLKLRERNLCNHRDYQNICFNGAQTGTMLKYLPSIARNKTKDKPALVLYGMLGNDVCRRAMKTLTDFSSVEEYRSHIVQTLDYLNETLPANSHVVLLGPVNGSFVYPAMGPHFHPIGKLHQDVTYDNIYEWFNCMEIGPCFGWMNKNETIREATQARVDEFISALKDLSQNKKYKTFRLYFISNPLQKIIEERFEQGHNIWEILEPVDSIHPVQEIQPLIANRIWEELVRKYPEAVGPVNPHNARIMERFSQQGGH